MSSESLRQVYLYGDKHHHLIEYIEHINNPNKPYSQKSIQKYLHNHLILIYVHIGAELGGAAGARAPPVLHNPRKFIV